MLPKIFNLMQVYKFMGVFARNCAWELCICFKNDRDKNWEILCLQKQKITCKKKKEN